MDLTQGQMTNMDPATMGQMIDYFEELSRKLDNRAEVKNVSPDSNFVSCIRFDGAPILPPILTARRKEEMGQLKRQAMRWEKQARASQRRQLMAKAKAIVAKTQGGAGESHSDTQAGERRQRGPVSSASYTKVPTSRSPPDRPTTRGTQSKIPVHQGAPSSTQAAEHGAQRLSGSPSYTVVHSDTGGSHSGQGSPHSGRGGALNDLSGGGLSESQPFSAFLGESSLGTQQGPMASRSYTISSEQSYLMQSGLVGAGETTGPAGTLAEREGGQWEEGLNTLDSLASDLPSLEDTSLPTDFNGLPLTSIRQQQISQVLAKLSKVLNIKDSTGFNSTSSSEVSEMTLTMQQVMTAAQQPGGLGANFPPAPGPSLQPFQGPPPAPHSHPVLAAPPGPQLSTSQPSLRQHQSEGDLSIFHESQDTVVEVEPERHQPAASGGEEDGSPPGNDPTRGGGSNQGLNNVSGSTQSNPSPQHNSSVSSANTSCTSDSQRSSRGSPRSSKNTVRFSSTVTEFSASQSGEGKVSKRCRDLTPTSSPQGPQVRDAERARGAQAGAGSLLSRVAFNPDMESSASSGSELSPEVPFGAYEQSGSDKENDARPPARTSGGVHDSRSSSQSVGSSQASTLVGTSQSSEASQTAGGRGRTVQNSLSSERSAVTSATSESESSTLRDEDPALRGGVMSSSASQAISQGRKSGGGRFFPPVSSSDECNEGESKKEPKLLTKDLSKGPSQKFPQQPNISAPASDGPVNQGGSQGSTAGGHSSGQNPSQQPKSSKDAPTTNHANVFQPGPSGQPAKTNQPNNPFFKAPVLHRHQNGIPNGVHHPEDQRQPEKKFQPGHARKGSYTLEGPSPVLLRAQPAGQSNGGGVECVASSVMKPLSRKLEYEEEEDEMDEQVLQAQPVSLPMPDLESEAKKEHIKKYLTQLEQQRSRQGGEQLSPQASRGLPQHHGAPAPSQPPNPLTSRIATDLATIQSILASMESNPHVSQEELLSLQAQQFELARQVLVEQQQQELEELFVMQRREQLALQQEIEEHQRVLHQQQNFLAENDPENLKPAKAHSPEDNTQQARPQNSFSYVTSPSLCRHPQDRDDVSTFSQTTPKKSLFTKSSSSPAHPRKPVLQSPYRPFPLPKRNAKVVVPKEASNPGMQAKFCRLSAVAKGFLTRRLLQTDKVQELLKTIHDTRQFAFSVQAETPIKKGTLSHQDRDLLERIVAQLQAALLDIHEIFFLIPVPDRMGLIASSREKERARLYRTSTSTEVRGSNPRLSSATLKALERKRKAQEAEVAVFGSTQTRPRTAPSTSSPRCQSHSTDLSGPIRRRFQFLFSRALRPLQGQISPIHPDPPPSRTEKERPKTAPERSRVTQAGNRRKTSTSNTTTASSTGTAAGASATSGKSTKSGAQGRSKPATGNKTKTRPSTGSKAWRE